MDRIDTEQERGIRSEQHMWDKALAEGAVDVNMFFEELNRRIESWEEPTYGPSHSAGKRSVK